MFGKGADGTEIAELHHVGAARADRGHLLDRNDSIHQRAADAAIRLRDGDAHEALFGHHLGDLERVARRMRALERIFLQMRQRKAPHRIGKQLLLRGQLEIHGVLVPGNHAMGQ